jgi:hypothetical protein
LAHLGSATADTEGNFSVTLTRTLAAGEGIRTGSTAQSAGVIGNYGAGTTTQISKLYLPMQTLTVSGPLTGEIGVNYAFTVTVGPLSATAPFDYAISASDAEPQSMIGSSNPQIVTTYAWAQPGLKTMMITVTNELGALTTSKAITIAAPPGPQPTDGLILLPLVRN